MRLLTFCLLFLFATQQSQAKTLPTVPEHMGFCDLELTLNSSARTYIETFIAKLHKSETYFQTLVDKANTYMPIVEEAFRTENVPDDLKFIVIQESAFNGKAVSKSGAVGFWQMKEASARHVGLVMNNQIDERKHIYRSSVGAARYFRHANENFDNWVYAIIGYNRGPVGAKAFVSEKNFGKKKLLVTGKTHWYALKAIAYKLAFQDEIGQRAPIVYLKSYATGGETSVEKLAKQKSISLDELQQYNPWIKGRKLPSDQNYIYYVPSDPPNHIGGEIPIVIIPDPRMKPIEASPVRQPARFKYLTRKSDPDHGKYYVLLRQGEQLPEVAVRTRTKTAKLREYNQLKVSDRLEAGGFLQLKPSKKMAFHIVRPGDTWQIIAGKYDQDFKKLQKRNLAKDVGATLYPNQKIYIKGKKPKGEKIIILEPDGTGSGVSPKNLAPKKPKPAPKAKSKYKTHTVKRGETLWRIAQHHKVSVDQLRKWNNLKSNEIFPGQKLRIK